MFFFLPKLQDYHIFEKADVEIFIYFMILIIMKIPASFYYSTLRRVKLVFFVLFCLFLKRDTAGKAENTVGLLALKCFSWLFGHSLPQYFVRNLLEPSASLFSCLNFFIRLVSGQRTPQPQSQIRPLEVLSRNYEH